MNKKRIIVSVLTVISVIGIGTEIINNSRYIKDNTTYTTIKGDLNTFGDNKLIFNTDVNFKRYTTEISKEGIREDISLINSVTNLSNKQLSDDFIKQNKNFLKQVNKDSRIQGKVNLTNRNIEILDDTSILYMGTILSDYNSISNGYDLELKGKLQDKDKNIKDISMKFNIKEMIHVYQAETKFIKKYNDKIIIGLDISGRYEKADDTIYKFAIITLDINTLKYDISIEEKRRNTIFGSPIVVDNKSFYYLNFNDKVKKSKSVEIIKGDINNVNKLEVIKKIDLENKSEIIDLNIGRLNDELCFIEENDDKTLNLFRYNTKDNLFKEYKNLKFNNLDTKGKEGYISDIILEKDKAILVNVVSNADRFLYEQSKLIEVIDLNTNKSLYTGQFNGNSYYGTTISEKN